MKVTATSILSRAGSPLSRGREAHGCLRRRCCQCSSAQSAGTRPRRRCRWAPWAIATTNTCSRCARALAARTGGTSSQGTAALLAGSLFDVSEAMQVLPSSTVLSALVAQVNDCQDALLDLAVVAVGKRGWQISERCTAVPCGWIACPQAPGPRRRGRSAAGPAAQHAAQERRQTLSRPARAGLDLQGPARGGRAVPQHGAPPRARAGAAPCLPALGAGLCSRRHIGALLQRTPRSLGMRSSTCSSMGW